MALTYPIQLLLAGKRCVVVGGGEIASHKASALLAAEGRVDVVSPELCPELEKLAKDKKIGVAQKNFAPSDLNDAFLVIAATDDKQVNRAVYEEANARRMLVNVVDVPEFCNFYVPSVIRRGDLAITISTGGASPALAKKIRHFLEDTFGDEYAIYLDILACCRDAAKEKYPNDVSTRMTVGRRVAALDLLPVLRRDGKEKALAEAMACI